MLPMIGWEVIEPELADFVLNELGGHFWIFRFIGGNKAGERCHGNISDAGKVFKTLPHLVESAALCSGGREHLIEYLRMVESPFVS